MRLSMNRVEFRVALAKKDTTQAKLAELLGLTPYSMSTIVNGKGVNSDLARRIAEAVDMKLEDLFFIN